MEEIKRKIEIEITDYKTIDGEIYSIEEEIKSFINSRKKDLKEWAKEHEKTYKLFYDWNNFKFDNEKLKEFNQDTWEHFKYYFFDNIVKNIDDNIKKYNSIKDINEFIEYAKNHISNRSLIYLDVEDVSVLFLTGFLDIDILGKNKTNLFNFNSYKKLYEELKIELNSDIFYNILRNNLWFNMYEHTNDKQYTNYKFKTNSLKYIDGTNPWNGYYKIQNINYNYSVHDRVREVLDFFKDKLSIEEFTRTIVICIGKNAGNGFSSKVIHFHYIWNYYKENNLGIITNYTIDEFLDVIHYLTTKEIKFVEGEFHYIGNVFTKEVKINKDFIMCLYHQLEIDFMKYNNFDRLDMLYYNIRNNMSGYCSLFPFQKDDYNMLFNKIDIKIENGVDWFVKGEDVKTIEKLIEDKEIVDSGFLCIITKINKIEGDKIYVDMENVDITRETFDKLSEKIKADEKKKLLDEKLKEIEEEKEKLLQEMKNL